MRSTPWRLVPFVVAILSGITLITVMLATSALSASQSGDQLIRLASPPLTGTSLRGMRSDLDTMEGIAAAVRDAGVPRLAALSGQTPAAFRASLAARDPSVSRGLAQLPAVERQAETIVTNLERRQGQFQSAAALPAPGLSLHQGALAALGLGAALVVVGVVGLLRPRRWVAVAIAAAGLIVVVVPLALGAPAKAADTDSLLNSLRPFSVEKVHARQAGLATVRTVLDGFQSDVVPQVARTAGVSPTTVAADMGAADPRLSPTALQATGPILDHFAFLVDFSGRIQPLLVSATRVPTQATTWLVIAPGVALFVSGVIGWRAFGRTRGRHRGQHEDA
jgi:hypothetical protein